MLGLPLRSDAVPHDGYSTKFLFHTVQLGSGVILDRRLFFRVIGPRNAFGAVLAVFRASIGPGVFLIVAGLARVTGITDPNTVAQTLSKGTLCNFLHGGSFLYANTGDDGHVGTALLEFV